MLKLAMLVGMQRGIKRLIINGDLVATDQDGLNEWITTWRTEGVSYESAIGLTRWTLHELARWFEEIDITEGNHDDRVARKTKGEVHLGMFLEGTIARYSRYSYLYMETMHRGLIKVVHPDNFSANPVTLGQEFYNVERGPYFDQLRPLETMRKCHFVVGHCHRQQSGMSPDGVYEIHSSGTLRDATRTAYKSKGQKRKSGQECANHEQAALEQAALEQSLANG